jgi:hypothetical protein
MQAAALWIWPVLVGAALAQDEGIHIPATAAPTFYITGLGNKCLSFAVPVVANEPVLLGTCHHGAGEQVGVQELGVRPLIGLPPRRHEVVLKAGTLCIGAEANLLVNNVPLVLQPCVNSTSQVFSLDGDSIILSANRDLVAQVQNAIPANATPIVLNRRDLADSEFWTFSASDGSGRAPTSGFTTPANAMDFCNQVAAAGYGTVIQVVPDGLFDVGKMCVPPVLIPAGVTVRGGRNGVLEGPQISLTSVLPGQKSVVLFQVAGEDVRITGLRILGTSRSKDDSQALSDGILIPNQINTIVDHNDISDWTKAAVDILGTGTDDNAACNKPVPPDRRFNARVVRNFVHHNEMHGLGYGVAIGQDGYASIVGNTFLQNRHAIAADGTQLDAYNAVNNLVLSTVPTYGFEGRDVEHDFDMHGSGFGTQHDNGVAGNSVLISGNTFLGTNRPNFILRGFPCQLDQFVNNISVHGQGDAVQWFCGVTPNSTPSGYPKFCGSGSTPPSYLAIDSKFGANNPTQRFGVGDFDGDGKDDLFLATGTAWYYAPAGNAEWRLLNAQSQTIDSLLFGDFDGDGRTDVLTKVGRDWLVSWGGISPWQKINESDGQISDFVVGNFVGDKRSDIFYATGSQWLVSDAGTGPFTLYATSSFRIQDLRFGDFDGDGRTDVMGIVANQWMAVFANQAHQWKKLNSELSDSVNELIVANFGGSTKTDIATFSTVVNSDRTVTLDWKVSRGGVGPWVGLSTTSDSFAAIGHFDNVSGADFLLWNGDALFVSSSATGAPTRQSRQDMR